MLSSPASSLQPPASSLLLDSFRRDRARGTNDDIDLTLRPAYRDLLAKLGDPHTKLPPVFHVAGTNGKGSTCAFLRSMLEAAGYRVHVYTSPHLVSFHERIRIAGSLISEEELTAILNECRQHSPGNNVTYFEAATAAAFTAFARHSADFTIIEVGLGGRLDATNVIPKPFASLITRLSFDHREYLGATMAKIAFEKAGIMRTGVPCFAAAQPDSAALQTLRDAAQKIHAPLSIGGDAWRVEKMPDGFRYSDDHHALDLPIPALLGEHQFGNAGLAIATLIRSQIAGITRETIAKGLQSVEWPARLQRLAKGALAALLPQGSELWLDGGHNDSAGEVLAQQAEVWGSGDNLPLHLICGMLTTKHPAEFLTPLRPYVSSFQAVPIADEPASFTAEALTEVARASGLQNAKPASTIEQAIKNLTSSSTQPLRILICGSLYLAGHVLRQNADNQKS